MTEYSPSSQPSKTAGQRIFLAYGKTWLGVDVPSLRVTILEPRQVIGLPNEESAFVESVRQPYGCCRLKDQIRTGDRVAVVIPDITRPLPSDRLLSWLLRELDHVCG